MTEDTIGNQIRKLVADVFTLTSELTRLTKRPFTPDGHLVGSIGETYGKYYYDIELYPPSHKGHDGLWRGREVQIKATQCNSVELKRATELLLVLKINTDGSFEEIYNGDGGRPWAALSHREPTKAGEISISLKRLRELNREVAAEDKILRSIE
ncbi:MAG: hypothetical protein A2218_10450 [Elusimicrobia bacterium RIFOXYA2_FULL_53_38]|nr:MAG: hypothetical protein A2218_10450 [Elusimicrobia bacterium RIFOXYA2_FULL_53_38]